MANPSNIDIPGYEVQEQIAIGGMSIVYLALHKQSNSMVALKIISQALMSDPTFSERFVREAKIVAKLDHPNIVKVYDVGSDNDHNYIAMEYLPNQSLRNKMEDGLTLEQSLMITSDLAEALDYAHEQGYIHRDVKPANILFRADGTPVLTDFGIARSNVPTRQMTMTGTVIGTPHYMSPEQALGRNVETNSDIYALGVLLFEMLTGNVPYDADSAVAIGIKHISDPIPTLPEQFSYLQPVINNVMAKEPAQRTQTGHEFVAALESAIPALQMRHSQQFDAVQITDTIIRPPTGTYSNAQHTATTKASLSATSQENRADQLVAARRKKITSKRLKIGALVLFALPAMWFGAEYVYINQNLLFSQTSDTQQSDAPVNDATNNQADQLYDQAHAILSDPTKLGGIQEAQAIAALQSVAKSVPTHSLAKNLLADYSEKHLALAELAIENNDLPLAIKHYELSNNANVSGIKLDQTIADLKQQLASKYQSSITNRTKIVRNLQLAETAINAKQYTSPKDSSALRYYLEVLAIEPGHAEAEKGLQTITEYYLEQANRQISTKSFSTASRALARAKLTGVMTDKIAAIESKLKSEKSNYLLAQKSQQQSQLAAQKEQQRNTKFEQYITSSKDHLAKAALDNNALSRAVSLYNSAAKLKANHSKTIELRNNVVNKLEQLIQVDLASNRFDSALDTLKIGQQLDRAPLKIRELKNEIESSKKAFQQAERAKKADQLRVDQLLAKAKNMQRSKHSDINSYNAIMAIYSEAKAISPNDSRITIGQSSVLNQIKVTATKLVKNKDLDQAKSFVDGGLSLFPADKALKDMLGEIEKEQLQEEIRTRGFSAF